MDFSTCPICNLSVLTLELQSNTDTQTVTSTMKTLPMTSNWLKKLPLPLQVHLISRPLYFQHDGHSRTIVGVQIKCQRNGSMQCNLLILDPGHPTESLEKSLRGNSGWKKLIKRGVHTLKKPLYQLCFIDPGVASPEEIENLKNLHSVRVEV